MRIIRNNLLVINEKKTRFGKESFLSFFLELESNSSALEHLL